jgi:hypothetical protein
MQVISFEEFSKNKTALAKLEQVKKKETMACRIVYDSINNFYINTDYGIYMSDGGKSSYTFPIYRDVISGELENLVINKNEDGEYESLIVIYDVTDAEKNMIENGSYVNLIDKTTFISLEENRINQDYCTYVEFGLIQHLCSVGGHTWEQALNGECPIYNGTSPGTPPSSSTIGIVIFNGICPEAGGNNNSNTSSDSGSNTTNGQVTVTQGSGSNSNAVMTTPVICGHDCIEEDVIVSDPCEELKNLLKNDTIINPNTPEAYTIKYPNLGSELTTIRERVYEAKEYGYRLNYKKGTNFDNSSYETYTANYLIAPQANGTLAFDFDVYTYGQIHTHRIQDSPIPSFGDLYFLLQCYEYTKYYNKSKTVVIVVVKNPVSNIPFWITYSLKIDDYSSFKTKLLEKLGCENCTDAQIKNKIEKIQNREEKDYGPIMYTHEKKFIEKYSDFGFSLYKANDDLSVWNKLKLVGDEVVPEPCNN